MRPSRRQLLATGSIGIGSALAGCTGLLGGGDSGNTITFGMTTALSGSLAGPGRRYLNGLKLWRDRVQENGGILDKDVELVHYDDESSADRSRTLYNRLLSQDGADFLIGPFGSGVNYAVQNISAKNKVPMVTGGGSDPTLFERNLDTFFAIHSKTSMYGGAFPKFIGETVDWSQYDVNKPEKAAVIYSEGAYNGQLATSAIQSFEEQGFDVAFQQKHPADLKDFSNIIAKIRNADPDIIAVYGYPQTEATFASQAMDSDLSPDVHYQNYSGTSAYTDTLGANANYTFSATWWDYRYDTPGVEDYVSMYRNNYDSDKPPMETAWGPTVGKVYKTAIENAGSTNRDDVNSELENIDIESICGRVQFHESGYNRHQYKFEGIRQWQNQNLELLAPTEFATAEPWLPTPAWSNRKSAPSGEN